MSAPHSHPTHPRRIGMQHACSIAAVAVTYMVDRATALEPDGWRGLAPSLHGNETLSKSMTRDTYDFYFAFIFISTMVAVASAICGITICLFCKSMPNSDMTCDSKAFTPKIAGYVVPCGCCEDMLKVVCCPDPVPLLSEEEKVRQARQESVRKMLKDVDNEMDVQMGGGMDSFRIDSADITTRLSQKNLLGDP
uniref:Uncharacterized protein n=1 Tax=Florenciella parvula TaxID=236787 RepID=A0A7S2FR32_9STRA